MESKENPFIQQYNFIKDKPIFKKLSGFDFDKFLEISDKISPEMDLITSRNTERKNESYKTSRFRNEHHLFITLVWLRHYPKNSLCLYLFCLSKYEFTSIINKTLSCIEKVYSDFIRWPNQKKFDILMKKYQDFCFEGLENIVCAIDGTEIQVPGVKGDEGRFLYSVKKKQFSVNFQILTLLDGSIIYISEHQRESSDQKQWNELGIRKKFIGIFSFFIELIE